MPRQIKISETEKAVTKRVNAFRIGKRQVTHTERLKAKLDELVKSE